MQSTYHERHKRCIHYIIKTVPVDTLAGEAGSKFNGHAHLGINFLCTAFHLKSIRQLSSAHFLRCRCHDFPSKPQYRSQKPQFLHNELLRPSIPHPPRPSLLFTAFYTCILFHAFINPSLACLHLSSNKRSCSKSMNSELRNRASPAYPFDPPGTGLLSVT